MFNKHNHTHTHTPTHDTHTSTHTHPPPTPTGTHPTHIWLVEWNECVHFSIKVDKQEHEIISTWIKLYIEGTKQQNIQSFWN